MHEYMKSYCEKCNKFSHCNNNDLICIARYRAKEQECEELKFTIKHTGLLDLMNKNVELKQALDEISYILESYYHNGISEIPQSQMELTINLLNRCEAKLCKISNIINKAKEG